MSNKKNSKKTSKKKKEEATRIMSPDQIKKCNVAIHSAAVAAAAAGVVPIPVADAVPITAAQVTMVIALGKIFKHSITESSAKALISAAASTLIGRTLVKFIPLVGWCISASVAASVTEAIGWSVAVDFAKNAKLQWEKEHTHTESTKENSTSESDTEDIITKILNSLPQRAKPFIDGKKTSIADEIEYKNLLNDFEKVQDKWDDKLCEMYYKLISIDL